ncbi:MAG: peptidoglycan glycosyltransferase FtsI [Candidatus Desulfovibrio kirbyi]|uniref:Peptidoglycan glycosyltransferase FtsI n=1 Tax=Candidatus Desulfovibrio kirbyi TaxID=2696086 RepID=A0A6L2R4L6_9BACT|nr:MAG: peptidoglycan glycosyltransferase FtsI [Candidatus Desulfovibrio kirbyi]
MFTLLSRRHNRPNAVRVRRKTASGDRAPHSGGGKRQWFRNVDWSRVRINSVVCVFGLLWLGIWGRAWHLQMIEGPHLADRAKRQHMTSELVTGRRGMIYDRNGQILARSIEVRSVYANPREIQDFSAVAAILGPVLGMDAQELYEKLSRSKRGFEYIKRKVDDYTAEAVRQASLPGIGLTREYDRIYPFRHMAGQLLGFVDMDGKGSEGLEAALESRLGSIPARRIVQRAPGGRRFYLHEEGQAEPSGQDVGLTIDVQMQFFAEEAVARASREYDARWSGALVVDVPTGDILAWAQYPFFNPNSYSESSPAVRRNRLAIDALEPGSTFKPFVMATALQERKVTPSTLIDCEQGRWKTKNFTIRDTSSHGTLPATKVLRYSSNIGMAKIGLSLGVPTFYRYLHAMGFGERTGLPLAEIRGILHKPRDWSEVDIMSTAFGQSVSVTGVQMAQAYLALLSSGFHKPLRLLEEEARVEEPRERVFSEQTAQAVVQMMRDVVQENDGTGKRARVDGVTVGGKTGTAQKADNRVGTYGQKRLASFVGFFPADRPRYLILVMVDEPNNQQFGGVVAAPVFREIAGRVVAYSGMLQHAPTIAKSSGDSSGKIYRRGLKLAGNDIPYLGEIPPPRPLSMNLPGHLAKASERVPDVLGKSVRNAVELFARAGIMPALKGTGGKVVRQSPQAGSTWADEGRGVEYILWLSER